VANNASLPGRLYPFSIATTCFTIQSDSDRKIAGVVLWWFKGELALTA